MRECFDGYCDKGKEIIWVNDGTEEGYLITTDNDCHTCEGTGMVDDECYCSAWNASECCCGAWYE